VVTAIAELERGRASYTKRAWTDAYESLSRADQASPLDPEHLELLARSAYMLGHDDEYLSSLERAHHAWLSSGDAPGAVRAAFWMGHNLLFRNREMGARGGFARSQRLLEGAGIECVEHGYLLIPVWLRQMASGDFETGYATAVAAAEIAERFGDADLVWLARDDQGRALLKLGRVEAGLKLVDEAMVAVMAGELSPIVEGIVYCNTIAFCGAAYELGRAREWTAALTQWCEAQPEMLAHNGLCLVHRAEIMQLQGDWANALEEAGMAAERFTHGALNQIACGKALYRQGEIHRLRGELAAAEGAYRGARRHGHEPQPGLALLRLTQGNGQAAASAIRRAMAESVDPLKRTELLPVYVEIALAGGDLDAARAACRELERISEQRGSEMLAGVAAQARGALALAEGDAMRALIALRRSLDIWHALEAPYEAARVRVLLGLACRALEDEDSALLELEAAYSVFRELGAAPDLARVERLRGEMTSAVPHGLTRREVEVLRLVAAGKSNRAVAAELVISEHTVARHVQNIFAKLGVSSRSAATAFAFEHELV
jgi:DNA-binding CsgD family transcriptional regulator